jgi:hypothetical protein
MQMIFIPPSAAREGPTRLRSDVSFRLTQIAGSASKHRTGNRQLNAALHGIALTQARCHPDARALLARRRAGGDGSLEALRVLKRHLSDVVYRTLRNDTVITQSLPA